MPGIRQGFRFWHFDKCLLVYRMHDNSAVWSHRADMFATATTNADGRISLRDHQVVAIRNHPHSLGRAVLGTGAAVFAIGFDYAEMLFVFNLADLHEPFLFGSNWLYRVDRADLRAQVAVLFAHAEFKIQCWLEQATGAPRCGVWLNY